MAEWTREAPGRYDDGTFTIQRETSHGGVWGATVWHISRDCARLDARPTLAAAKARAAELANAGVCWSSDCGRTATQETPKAAISLGGTGTVATCTGCHRYYTTGRRSG